MKTLLSALFIFNTVFAFSQDPDTIFLINGEIIPCQVEEISKSGLVTYNYINSSGELAMAQKATTFIKEIKYASGISFKYAKGIQINTAQDSAFQKKIPKKPRFYITKIKTMDKYMIKELYMYEIKEEEITAVSKKKYEKGAPVVDSNLTTYKVDHIMEILVRRKGDIWKGTFIGGATGFILGGIIGSVLDRKYGEDRPQTQKMAKEAFLVWGAVGLSMGFAIGAVIGSDRNLYSINGNQSSFEKVREELEKRSIKYYYP